MNLKKIQAMPFAPFHEESKVRWKVTVKEPVVDGERLLVVDFLENLSCTAYRRDMPSFRIVCAKKSKEVKGINHEGRIQQKVLNCFSTPMWWYNEYVLISPREEEALRRFLKAEKTENHQMDNLCKWIKQTRQEMKKRSMEKRGELMDEDYRLCPEALPEGLIDYIRREVLPEDRVIIYKRGNVNGICTVCGTQVHARGRRFTQSAYATCPNCGARVICVLEDGCAFAANYIENIVAVQKGTDGETVFFRQWLLHRDNSARWEHIEDFLQETVRYAIRGNKTAKWQKQGKESYYMRTERYELDEWTRWQDNRIYDGSYFFYPTGIEEALSGTAMQYADLEGYLEERGHNKNPIYFLEYHARYPVIEFLWKAGYRNIVHNRIFGMDRENRNAILWERKKLKECFKFPLRILKLMPPEEWSLNDIQRVNDLWEKYGGKVTDTEIRLVLQSKVDIQLWSRATTYANAGRILKYIKNQTDKRKEKNPDKRSISQNDTAQAYRDYLQECEQLHLDLHDKEILFPKDLTAAHNRTMEQVKFEKNKADQEKFQKAVEKLEKFAWGEGEFFIRPAREQMELTAEGKALHHCVGGYIRDMAEEKTAIFFLRKANEPDKPFYTLELQKKRVIQCRTEHNASYDRNPDVKNFVDMWMEKVVKKGGKKKAKEAAA
ncbi:PcfJ domain-containing protein [Anaerotignum faecicola]